MRKLKDKVAIITGATSGIGKATARLFAQEGADLVITGRRLELGQRLEQEIQELGVRCAFVEADHSRADDCSHVVERTLAEFGRVDILFNNAGGNRPQSIDQVTDETWDYYLELNLSSCMALTRALVPQMKERRWGRIIYTSSILGFTSVAGRNVYSATKSALLGLARANAIDLGAFGITANCIAPGPFATELTAANFTQEARDTFASRTALGRWGETSELVGPALLLASDAGSYITGTTIVVDGGVIIKTM